jgi:lipoprotein-releasing system permease protein
MIGMVLGVASLIVVLSVMNGFAAELRGRILSLVPHGYVEGGNEGITNWRELAHVLVNSPDVVAASPYITEKVLLRSQRALHGAVMTAIDPDSEAAVSDVSKAMVSGSLEALGQGEFQIVLGSSLARILGVVPGDMLEATVPRLLVTPLGVFPRSKRLRVIGIFEVGAQPDAYQSYVSLATGQKLIGLSDRVDGLQLRTTDLFSAPATLAALAAGLPESYTFKDWSETQGSLFRAVKMEKVMVSLLLLSVVAVAAFNIVSTLVMSVTEKRRDIAVLRTMGARAGGIMAIFVAHGLALATIGIGMGILIGVPLASNVSALVSGAEQILGVKLFDPNIYFISELPAQLQWTDVLVVVVAAFSLSLLATLYPAWRAARIAPAEVLRYE